MAFLTRKIQELRRLYLKVREQVRRHWRTGIGLAVFLFILTKKDVDIALDLTGPEWTGLTLPSMAAAWKSIGSLVSLEDERTYHPGNYSSPQNTSMLEAEQAEYSRFTGSRASPPGGAASPANTFSNFSFSEGDSGGRESERARAAKRHKQEKYINTYARIARKQMKEFSIPASITLAQGLLESNAGESSLAVKNHNHFGIKCFSRSCRKGHCSNFSDDHHKDFFRIYRTPEESYQAHSLLLRSKRYRHLFRLAPSDYRGWAFGLAKAGYATDKNYAEKLIYMIEDLELYRYDRKW